MNALTPSGSLFQLFREAEKAGLLSFPDEANRKAFFRPYRAGLPMSDCFNDVETAAAYFTTPPWRSTTFPPKARAGAALRYPASGSPAVLVDPPAGWDWCRNELGGLYLSSDDGPLFELSILTMDGPYQASMDKFIPAILRGAGFPAFSRSETATILGGAGTAYTSSKSFPGKTIELRIVAASLDPTHAIVESIVTPTDLTPARRTALAKVLASVRRATP